MRSSQLICPVDSYIGDARIFAVWEQSQGHRGAKQGMSLGHLAIHGDMWGQMGAGPRAQGGSCPLSPPTLAPPMDGCAYVECS